MEGWVGENSVLIRIKPDLRSFFFKEVGSASSFGKE